MAALGKKITKDGKSVGSFDLPKAIFDEALMDHLVYDYVLSYLASQRQGTAKVKGRSEVSGGGKKPYRQKGTGNARQGSSRAPNHVGGGVVFGPNPRSYKYSLPKKMRARALRSVLNQKMKEEKLFIIDDLAFDKPDTKLVASMMKNLDVKKALIVDQNNKNLYLSARNLKSAKYVESQSLNVFDILKYDNLLLSTAGLRVVEERLTHED
ncbi:MAG: 50S ribosomal protein L4 [Bdellovibrionales bacterium]|nr:50S ribosomal protein L4 [Bdellovibrionales bacterium]